MKINVEELKLDVGREADYDFVEPLESVGIKELDSGQKLHVHAHLLNTGESILARVEVRGKARMECGRCLGRFEWPFAVEFEEEYKEKEPGRYDGEVLDLAEDVRENVLLAVPMKPVCSEACKGLCPVCGRNRNLEPCDCEPGGVDPRLAALKDLLSKEERNTDGFAEKEGFKGET